MTKSSMTQTNTIQNDKTMSDALTTLNNTHRSDFDREWAIHKLSRSPTPQNTRRLVAALEDNEFGVRWAAAVALAELGQPALRPLLEALIIPAQKVSGCARAHTTCCTTSQIRRSPDRRFRYAGR